MFTRCLVCLAEFPQNDVLEHFRRGERVAYDPERGRLWAICSACRRWTLAPIEDRWEALEELEKATHDRGRLLSSTDRIALFRVGPIDVVRVGRAQLREEAWWRYGRELRDRRKKFRQISFAGTAAIGAAILGSWSTGGIGFIGAWFLWEHAPDKVTDVARWLRFGSDAWRGDTECPRCGRPFQRVRYSESDRLILLPNRGADAAESPIGIALLCPGCRHPEGGFRLPPRQEARVLRSVLARHHWAGASDRRIESATRLIQEAGGPEQVASVVVRDGRRLGDLGRTGAIALEIASHDDHERRLLQLELEELETRWREEEELAAIVDGELTPLPLLEKVRRRVVGIE